ncbi:2Fe-2S iron-sulfur cluster-binding protein [Gordonia sp. FQ]|uniref:2Fe-2S iron-sulfur cluster-binding protein n=1 Tax=Gordonia sp. FQ TaxID=3446634 RepID=UPI003F868313
MPKITFTDSSGHATAVDATVGDSVMETAVRNGVPEIVAECGGSLSCATCHVIVDATDFAGLPEMSEMEDEMLYGTSEDRVETSRLCCQIKVTEDMDLHVTTPETQV